MARGEYDGRKTARVEVKVAPTEMKAWRAAAKRAGVTVGAWVRGACAATLAAEKGSAPAVAWRAYVASLPARPPLPEGWTQKVVTSEDVEEFARATYSAPPSAHGQRHGDDGPGPE